RVLALGGSMDDFAAGLKVRDRAPGEAWQYVSIDTHVLGMVIRGATGRSVIELMAEKLVQTMGLEGAKYYVKDGYGTGFVLGGTKILPRNFARIGEMFMQDGLWYGR